MSGASKGYDFGTKRHWRRWVWNRIRERAAVDDERLCFYLPGANDFDRTIALDRGFRAHNLIGVERDARALASARKSGALVVDADFLDVVDAAVTGEHSIGVIFGDFCGGLHPLTFKALYRWMACISITSEAVFAFNLKRGRDPAGNAIRTAVQGCTTFHHPADQKHRGLILLAGALFALAHSAEKGSGNLPPGFADYCEGINSGVIDPQAFPDDMASAAALVMQRAEWLHERCSVAINSYRSDCGDWFDTIVFTSPFRGARLRGTAHQALKADGTGDDARRALAAVLAHRTMRFRQDAAA